MKRPQSRNSPGPKQERRQSGPSNPIATGNPKVGSWADCDRRRLLAPKLRTSIFFLAPRTVHASGTRSLVVSVCPRFRTIPTFHSMNERTDMNCKCTDSLTLKIWDRSTIVATLDVMVQDLATRAATRTDSVVVSRSGPDTFTARLIGDHSCLEVHQEVPC